MYLQINGVKYPDVHRYYDGNVLSYTGTSLTNIESLSTIDVYRDDDFLLATDDTTEYPYQTITDGHILLRKYEPIEPQISDDEALSIVTGTMTATEALNIITGGGDE